LVLEYVIACSFNANYEKLKQSSTPTSNVKTTQAKVAHEDANVPATQDTKSFLARLSSNTKGLTVMTNAPLPIPAAKPNPTPKTLEDQMNAMNTEILDANAPTHSTLTSFKLDQVFNTLDKQGKPVPLDPAHEYYAVLQYLTPLQRAVLGTLKEKTKDTYDRVLADLREDWDIEF
jgi:hypothetical protein